jgi:hypothetical protein
MSKKHVNIPIFIPHLGCPNQCVFCNQKTISGVHCFDINSVKDTIDQALLTVSEDTECEIAFFGGSFTGIDKELMESLLIIANAYLEQGRVSSVRCSTRPDYINREVLKTLKRYGVGAIELGLQSASDSVLSKSKRGHTSKDEADACKLITEYGFSDRGDDAREAVQAELIRESFRLAKEMPYLHSLHFFRLFDDEAAKTLSGADDNASPEEAHFGVFREPHRQYQPKKKALVLQEIYGGTGDLSEIGKK